MRCWVCGADMRLVLVVPDHELEVPGYERHTLECSGCGEREIRLAFSREPTQVPSQTQVPSHKSKPSQPSRAPAPVLAEPVPPATEPTTNLPQVTPPEEPAPSLTAVARSAWETAVARLRSRQTVLSEQAESARKAEHLARFDREWDKLAPKRKSIASQISGREPIPVKAAKRSAPPARPPSSGLWARAVAKLRDIEKDSER
jgi:hypothetical protein